MEKAVSTIKVYLKIDCIKRLEKIDYREFGEISLADLRSILNLRKSDYFFRDS